MGAEHALVSTTARSGALFFPGCNGLPARVPPCFLLLHAHEQTLAALPPCFAWERGLGGGEERVAAPRFFL